jgi:hypothetical protein
MLWPKSALRWKPTLGQKPTLAGTPVLRQACSG